MNFKNIFFSMIVIVILFSCSDSSTDSTDNKINYGKIKEERCYEKDLNNGAKNLVSISKLDTNGNIIEFYYKNWGGSEPGCPEKTSYE